MDVFSNWADSAVPVLMSPKPCLYCDCVCPCVEPGTEELH